MTLFSTFNQPLTFWLFCYLGFVSGGAFFISFWLSNFFCKNNFFAKFFQKILKKWRKNGKNDTKNSNLKKNQSKELSTSHPNLTLREIIKKMKKDKKEKTKQEQRLVREKIKEQKRRGKKKKLSKSIKKQEKRAKKEKNNKIFYEKRLKRIKNLKKNIAKILKMLSLVCKFVKKYFFVALMSFVLGVCIMGMLKINFHFNFGEISFFNLFAYFLCFCVAKRFLKTFAKILAKIYNVFIRRRDEKLNG